MMFEDEEQEDFDYQSAKEDAETERFDAWVEETGRKHGIDAIEDYRNR